MKLCLARLSQAIFLLSSKSLHTDTPTPSTMQNSPVSATIFVGKKRIDI